MFSRKAAETTTPWTTTDSSPATNAKAPAWTTTATPAPHAAAREGFETRQLPENFTSDKDGSIPAPSPRCPKFNRSFFRITTPCSIALLPVS
jgi:hypothetical protein